MMSPNGALLRDRDATREKTLRCGALRMTYHALVRALGARFAIASAAACASPKELADVAYDPRFGDATKLDVYLPEGASTRRPGVLFFHGGLWNGRDKSEYASAAKRL